jgi:hypothetical protein
MVTVSSVRTDRNSSAGTIAAITPESVKNRSIGNNGLSANELTINTREDFAGGLLQRSIPAGEISY